MSPPELAVIRPADEAAATAPRGRGRPAKRSLKLQMLLDGAAELFNLCGISATSVADVADILGLSRASLYYYVDDREDLVFQCYLRACELTADDLAAAAGEPTGLSRTLVFVEHALLSTRPTAAVLSEIDVLNGARAQSVKAANDRNTANLIGFIAQGMEDGSIRACDPEVIAQAIAGMLAWAQLLPQWSGSKQMQLLRARTSKTMISLLTTGLAVERGRPFRCRIDVEQFQRTLVNAFDRREASSVKIDQVLAAASRLFNRNGIEATSVDSIAASLGVTKGVLYHYLADKSELVTRCYERAFDFYDQFIEVSKREGGRGLDRALINGHLNIQAHISSITPLMPQPGFGAVPEARRMSLMKRGRRENEVVADLLREGAADGSAVACDAAMVTHICAGAFGWIPKWLPADDTRTRFEIADEICAVLANGLSAA
ncbi:MAG TPA: TetR/AcrR family transcriptional regulator [Caulobacteraceae bacterium]|jgi:AcrR family transcriptional regulator|nr:TetR/AcrR family transcriptional regulator [Caulobacteraceae bacterium]